MSAYVGRSVLNEVIDEKEWWQTRYSPSQTVPVSGIFRCVVCGRENACNKGDPFPPQNHHQHDPGSGPIRWLLNVRAETKGS